RHARIAVGHARGAALVRGGHEARPGGDHCVGHMEVAAADDAEDALHPVTDERRPDGFSDIHCRSMSARTRQGLPEPPTIGSGPTMSTAPRGGSFSRFCSCVRPYLSWPRRNEWQGNGGWNECAAPASVPTVSTPTPTTGASSASHLAQAIEMPGV